jgi:hypothetical protein
MSLRSHHRDHRIIAALVNGDGDDSANRHPSRATKIIGEMTTEEMVIEAMDAAIIHRSSIVAASSLALTSWYLDRTS